MALLGPGEAGQGTVRRGTARYGQARRGMETGRLIASLSIRPTLFDFLSSTHRDVLLILDMVEDSCQMGPMLGQY